MFRLLTLLLCHFCTCLCAQVYQYSLYEFTPSMVNPAEIAIDNNAELWVLFREQNSISNYGPISMQVTGKYPILQTRKSILATSLNLSSTREGIEQALKTDEIGGTVAFSIIPNKNDQFSIGISPSVFLQRFNLDHLSTGTQYVESLGFDPRLDNGEAGDLSTFISSYSLGFQWSRFSKKRQEKILMGASWQQLTAMNLDQDISGVLNIHSRVRLASTRSWEYNGEMLFRRNGYNGNLIVGAISTYKVPHHSSRLDRQSLSIISKYLLRKGMMLGLQWDTDLWSIGTSYDLAIGDRVGFQGAFELGFNLRKSIRRKRPYKRRRKKGNPSRITRNRPINEKTEVIIEEDTVQIEFIADSLHMPYTKITLLDEYPFGEVEPGYHVLEILDEVVFLLQSQSFSKVEIIGHTDNVGSQEYNQNLSTERAKLIYEILIDYGISEEKLGYSGRGESEPLNDNSTSALRKLNRRVEIIVYHD